MALVITGQPERYNLAYNDNVWCFYESTLPDPTRRYIVNVIDASTSTSIGQFTVLPSVDTIGSQNNAFFDPSRILQTRLESCIAIPSANHVVFNTCNTLGFNYGLSIESQDKDANGVYQRVSLTISDVKTVWNGGVNKIDWLSFDYTDYDMITGSSEKSFLTNAPSVQYIESDQSAFLSFFNSDNSNMRLILTSFDSSGATIQNGRIDLTTTDFNYLSVGTYDIENSDASVWVTGNPSTFLVGASYYTIALNNGSTHETITYNINQRCSKYEPIRLHWLNRLGGYDSFNFSLKSMESTDIDRRSYQQNPRTFTGNFYRYETYDRGVTDYHVGTQRKLTINTPFLTESESVWMEDFATSPIIYQEINNQLIAMSGKVKMIDKQTSLNDKLMQYTFELDYSLNDMRQRG